MKSPFVVGVTGHMDLRDEAIVSLRWNIECSLRYLMSRQAGRYCLPNEFYRLFLSTERGHDDASELAAIAEELKHWPVFEHTPLKVLTSLAPGADSLVACVALQLKAEGLPIEVVAPLPFPHQLYPLASTFPTDESVREYRRLLKAIGAENTFCVRVARDRNLDDDALFRQCSRELEPGCLLRRERYRTAGEYIADYSHLLLAIWDDDHDADTAEGTAAIVNSRIVQVPFGDLPDNEGLNIPNGGPVLHLRTHRQKNDTVKPEGGSAARFLHCDIFRDPYGKFPPDEAQVQRESLSVLCGEAASLENFNAQAEPSAEKLRAEFIGFLSGKLNGSFERLDRIVSQYSLEWYGRMYRMVNLRTRASGASRQLDKDNARRVLWMFVLAFTSAAMLHPFFSWATDELSVVGFSGIRMALVIAALLSSSLLVVIYILARSSQRRERAHDYRALAEGLRVQLFWNLAGLGTSVPANYLQRQRSELDWIRSAIREAAAPYDYWKHQFNGLNEVQKVQSLKCVQENWVMKQVSYFKEKTWQNRELTLGCRKLGILMAAGGMIAVLGLAVAMFWSRSTEEALKWLDAGVFWKLLFVMLMLLVTAWMVSALRRLLEEKCSIKMAVKQFVVDRTQDDSVNSDRKDSGRRSLFVVLDRLIYTEELHARHATSRVSKRRAMVINAGCYALVGMALALALFLLAKVLASASELSPETHTWVYILIGITVLSGASCLAWSEKKMYSELAYQYNTMAPLFVYADIRLRRLIDEYEQMLETDQFEYFTRRKLAEIHGLLFELGLEALDENAEWLLLHRARPMMPVVQ